MMTAMSKQLYDFNVACHHCGQPLGSNPNCGKGTKMKRPPCLWAHTDDAIVRKALAHAKAQKEKEENDNAQIEQAREAYAKGQITFGPSPHDSDAENETAAPNIVQSAAPPAPNIVQSAAPPAPNIVQSAAPPALVGQRAFEWTSDDDFEDPHQSKRPRDDDEKAKEKKTQWNSITRTMLYRCIQKYDPFSAKDKGATWSQIAQAMHASTEKLQKSADGDFRVYSSGKTLNVFYQRARDKMKREQEGHSGHAGNEESSDRTVQEERSQLAACVALEKSAKDAGMHKREATKHYDNLRAGVCNDAIIEFAKKDAPIRMKAVKVLSSNLRAAKIRKSSFEATHKGQTYTYTDADLQSFDLWKKLHEADATLPEDPTTDADLVREKRSGPLAAAISSMTKTLETATPLQGIMSPADFANAFYAAKRAHEMQTVLSLQQKLAIIDADVANKVITAEQGKKYKEKVMDKHYAF
jgi:hypothetical protein